MRDGSGSMGRGALRWPGRVPLCISLIFRTRSVWLAVYIHGIKGRAAGFDWTAGWGRSMQYVVDGVVETGADHGRHANGMAVGVRAGSWVCLGRVPGLGLGLELELRVSSTRRGHGFGEGEMVSGRRTGSPVNVSRGSFLGFPSLGSSASSGLLWVSRSRRAYPPTGDRLLRSCGERGLVPNIAMANGKGQRLEGARFLSPDFPSLFSCRRPHWLRQREGEVGKARRGCHWTTPAASAAQSWLSFKG